jgi:serine phosphatase RsbU (regulator of sigma subunit)
MKKAILYFIFFHLLIPLFSQSNIDGLKALLATTNDTSKIRILFTLFDLTADNDSATGLSFINQAQAIAEKYNLYIDKAKCVQLKGNFYKKRGEFQAAIDNYNIAAQVFEQIKNYKLLAGTYNNLGATYVDKGDYKKSIEYLIQSLRISDQVNDIVLKSKVLLNIGLVFYYQKNYDKALEYYYQSLEIRKNTNDIKGIALIYNNLGNVYYFEKRNKEAIKNFKNSLSLYEKIGNKRGMSIPYFNIGEIYYNTNNMDSALYYYDKSYAIDSFLQDKANITKSLQKKSEINLNLKKIDKAIQYGNEALSIAIEIDSKEDIKECYRLLGEIYTFKKDYKKALDYTVQCSIIKDTIYSKQSSEAIAELQTQYETEKKDLQLSKQNVIIRNQKIISRILIAGIIISVFFITLILWQFIQKKRAYKILELQKKNITDSINYASRIQSALLPPENLLNELLPEHFVLYLPRDIVSGDFYWITIVGNKTIIAVADCTGHGVPGAFMSMLGFAYLNEIVNKTPDLQAHEILNELRVKVKTTLHQNNDSENKDGIDIALAIIDPDSKMLQYSGANNPLIICRNNSLINLPPDKMPIGIHSFESESFTLHNEKLEPGDIVYMFSDGYMDQFGGEKVKKLGKNNFEKILLTSSQLSIKAQRYYLEEKILEWMVDYEQIDDILVMGIKIS